MKKIIILILLFCSPFVYSATIYSDYENESSAYAACQSAATSYYASNRCTNNGWSYSAWISDTDVGEFRWRLGGCAEMGLEADASGMCITPPPIPCTSDNSQPHCGAPSYTGDSVVNEDGSETDTINECYADGSCKHTSTTSSTTENPDGSSTYTESVTNSTSTSDGETSTETSSTVTHSDVTTSDSGTKLTETTTTTDSEGLSTTTTTTSETVHNDDGTTSQTVTVTSETGEQISSETTTTNTDGTTSDPIDCTDIAYINNPACRIASVDEPQTSQCGDNFTVVGENRCVSQCEEYYVKWGNTCTKSVSNPESDPPAGEDPIVTEIKKSNNILTQIKGINEQTRQQTKRVDDSINNQTKTLSTKLDSIKSAIDAQGPNVGGGGGDTTVDLDGLIDEAPNADTLINGYNSELQTKFDDIGIQSHIDGITGEEFTQNVSLGDSIKGKIPSVGCSSFSQNIPGTDQMLTITCADSKQARDLFAYLFYILTAIYCFHLITSKSATA